MPWHSYLPIIVTIGSIAGAIAALTIFFSLWGVVHRSLRRVGQAILLEQLPIGELANAMVRVRLKSKTTIESVVVQGFQTGSIDGPYRLGELLVVRFADSRTAYIRIEEIEYLETLNATGL